MTENEILIIQFTLEGKNHTRYLCEYEYIIPINYNKRYEWMIRSARLGKMVKKGLLYPYYASNRYDQSYRVTQKAISLLNAL